MRVIFIASRGKNNIIVKNQGDSLVKKGVEIDYFPLKSGIFNYLIGIFRLKKLLKNQNYDLIHAHYGWSGLVAVLTFTKTPIVISFMGDDLIGTLNKSGKYSILSRIVSKMNILLAKKIYSYSIVKSKNLFDYLNNIKNKTIIPNGIDLKTFKIVEKTQARKNLGWDIDKSYIIFISDPNRVEKNFVLAKKSVDLINSDKVELVIINNIENSIIYKYYSAADCLILTSYHEGSPNVIKEAMACSCPIVSTDVGDVKLIIGNIEGCFISSFDPYDVSEKLKLALDFSKRFNRTKGRERIIELGLDSDSIAEKIIKVYKEVLSCAEFVE